MSTFRNFRVGKTGVEFTRPFWIACPDDGPVKETIYEAYWLANRAAYLFAGLHLRAPFKAEPESPLPWFAEYNDCNSSSNITFCPLSRPLVLDQKEIAATARAVRRMGRSLQMKKAGYWTLIMKCYMPGSNREGVQCFTIETLVHIDTFLGCVRDGRHSEGLTWIAGAHTAFTWATRDAQAILGDQAHKEVRVLSERQVVVGGAGVTTSAGGSGVKASAGGARVKISQIRRPIRLVSK